MINPLGVEPSEQPLFYTFVMSRRMCALKPLSSAAHDPEQAGASHMDWNARVRQFLICKRAKRQWIQPPSGN